MKLWGFRIHVYVYYVLSLSCWVYLLACMYMYMFYHCAGESIYLLTPANILSWREFPSAIGCASNRSTSQSIRNILNPLTAAYPMGV